MPSRSQPKAVGTQRARDYSDTHYRRGDAFVPANIMKCCADQRSERRTFISVLLRLEKGNHSNVLNLLTYSQALVISQEQIGGLYVTEQKGSSKPITKAEESSGERAVGLHCTHHKRSHYEYMLRVTRIHIWVSTSVAHQGQRACFLRTRTSNAYTMSGDICSLING